MNSQTSKIAQNIRLQEWAHMIQECKSRPAGMTIGEWCAQHNITKCDYYYRMRAVRKACIEAVPTEVVQQAIVPVSMELLNSVDDHSVPSDAAETIELTFHGVNIKVTHQTSDELLKKVLGVLVHVE